MDPVELDNRLHAVWEKLVELELSLYDANDNWSETRPIDAPRKLHKMANSLLETACELDAVACDLEAADKAEVERRTEMCAQYGKMLTEIERDGCTKRFGEIVRSGNRK